MKIKWQDKVTNRELLERATMERLNEEVIKKKEMAFHRTHT